MIHFDHLYLFSIGSAASVIRWRNCLVHCSVCVGTSVEPVRNQWHKYFATVRQLQHVAFCMCLVWLWSNSFHTFLKRPRLTTKDAAQRPQTQGRLQCGCVCVCKVLAAQVSVEQGVQGEGGRERERKREYHGKLKFSSARRLEICSQVVDRVASPVSSLLVLLFSHPLVPLFSSLSSCSCWL